ncbi:hypothetical protein G8770_18800 [Aestuariicella hydrocarbonica]|uniref:Uncharacterized protein n=1 Tax=Pseudomaricurvus hydrocarbonicus TaxID=1470433 RepID=A0A9E5MNQ4_9GAMM|nr:hypothetical protein [Aestuariicella hydrocarbonica]NHO67600.1 hypothetical protein [Aestuariicella hydrocarbonica]
MNMLLPTILFLAFCLWTLFHWQTLPTLLKNESEEEHWPLSIHHTATPARMVIMTLLYTLFSYSLLFILSRILMLFLSAALAPWVALAILIGSHFAPYMSGLCAYVRYFFQRHLFFPSLPSHQEDSIIRTLMSQAPEGKTTAKEISYLHNLIRGEFKAIHAFNLMALKNEGQLVKREFKKMRLSGLIENETPTPDEQQQMRFHLYACYRLLTRITLARHWAGRDRRRAFRRLGYTINTGDGEIYARCRRLKHAITQLVLHRGHHHGVKAKR